MLSNRKSMVNIAVMLSITALTAFASIAQADGGDGRWGGEQCSKQHRHDFKKHAKKLGLTDTQKTQSEAIFQGNRDVVKPIITSLRVEKKNLQVLIQADPVDEAAIRAETAKIAGIQADLNVNRAKVAAQFRAILTPAQLVIEKTLHQKCHKTDDVTTTPVK